MIYKNIKNGSLYRIMHYATDVSNNKSVGVVVYVKLDKPITIFVRNENE